MAEGGICDKAPEALSATTPLANVRDIMKCSKCQHQLHDPKTLQCLHSFCNQCLNEMEKSEKDGATGYECPQCQRFTNEKDIRVFQLIVQLLDAQKDSKFTSKVAKCERCNSRDAKWFCVVCKKLGWLCEECKETHDEYVEEHKTLSLDEMKEANYVVDKPVYCSEHRLNEIELYCVECDKTMCLRCKVYSHEGHRGEPIDEALNRILPQVTCCVDKIKENIKVKQDHIKATEKEKEEAIEKYNKQIRDDENEVCEQNQVIAWVATVVAKTKRASQLQHFQDGLLDKIHHLVPYEESQIHSTRCWPWAIETKALRLSNTIDLTQSGGNYPYTRIAILWDRIWMINHDTGTVYIYNFDGEKDGEFQLDEKITKPRTAVQVYSGEAVVAAQSGLFAINKNGKVINSIQIGDFSDVSLGQNGILNALEHIQGCIFRFKSFGKTWQKQEGIHLQTYENYNSYAGTNNYLNTFVVKDNTIFVGMIIKRFVLRYDMSGNNVEVMANMNTGLSYPCIGGIDNENALLISNRGGKGRIDFMDHTGNIQMVLSCAFYPWFAVYQNDKTLWCIDNSKQLKKFVHE